MMNMPQPITKKNYSQLSSKLKDGAKFIAEASMVVAANEVKEKEGTSDIGVSVTARGKRGDLLH